MKISDLTFAEYKRIANEYLARHKFPRNNKLPLNIETLIYTAGHRIVQIKNMYHDFGVKGVVIKVVGGFDIGIDQNHYDKEDFYCTFTLAEELAHIIIHSNIYDGINSLNDREEIIDSVIQLYTSIDEEEYHKMESQARVIASHLLLPQTILENYVMDWCEKNIHILSKGVFYTKEDLADFIAEKIYKNLIISKHVLSKSLNRYPDLIVNRIIDKYGKSLIQ